MLWEAFLEPCTLLSPVRADDGQGGFATSWEDGEGFEAAVVRTPGQKGEEAGKAVEGGSYTVTAAAALAFGDVFRRESDGKTFRMTAAAAEGGAPAAASFSFLQGKAEAWEVPA